jgi:hypothetical protein
MWTLRCFIQLGGTDVDLGKPWGAAEVTFGDIDAYQRRRIVDEAGRLQNGAPPHIDSRRLNL